VRRKGGALAGWALCAALAACQPLPHPFADDRPPAALMVVPDSIDIAIGTFEGEPTATASKLSAAVASELLQHNITATAQTTSHTSFALEGRIEEAPAQAGQATVTFSWWLRDAAGQIVNQHSNRVTAPARAWAAGDDAPITQLAAASADVLASLVTEATPKEQQQASGRVRVAVRNVGGAPGDGDGSLATSMTAVLRHADVDIVDAKTGKPDLTVDANVVVEPKANQQHVKIVWHVARANGSEVGTVVQENDLPRGRLDGPWGDIAYNVAIAAGSGIMQLVDRGAPPLKLGAATAAAQPPASPSPERPATPIATQGLGPGASPPAPGNLQSPAVVLPPVSVGPEPDAPATVPVLLPPRGVPLPPH